MVYKVVVQVLLLYGIEIWVLTDEIMMLLGGLCHTIARHIVGVTERKGDGGEWEWVLVDAALDTTGFLADKGVREEATVKNLIICIRETNIQNLYRHIVGGGFQ